MVPPHGYHSGIASLFEPNFVSKVYPIE